MMDNKRLMPTASTVLGMGVALLLAMGGLQQASADGGGTYSVYDADRDGFLSREEFEVYAEKKRRRAEIADIWVFEAVDRDADGKISERELVDALQLQLKRKRELRR